MSAGTISGIVNSVTSNDASARRMESISIK